MRAARAGENLLYLLAKAGTLRSARGGGREGCGAKKLNERVDARGSLAFLCGSVHVLQWVTRYGLGKRVSFRIRLGPAMSQEGPK